MLCHAVPQDCPDSGALWAETINMAPRPQRKSRSGARLLSLPLLPLLLLPLLLLLLLLLPALLLLLLLLPPKLLLSLVFMLALPPAPLPLVSLVLTLSSLLWGAKV